MGRCIVLMKEVFFLLLQTGSLLTYITMHCSENVKFTIPTERFRLTFCLITNIKFPWYSYRFVDNSLPDIQCVVS